MFCCMMKCYYEVLEVPREAGDLEIKTSYRKLALKWHPDKNIDNTDLAKEQFQLVQQAYEVLSDRHERAWYDNHREQILRGSNSEYEDDSLDVFLYFTTQCFKGYGDDEKGFYTVYRNVFEQLAKEDIEYMDSKSDFDEIPHFGNSASDYEETVAPFYAYWMSYSTRKSYVWLDPYSIKETRERRVAKLIEKENKKVRLKAKKERNDEVRNLVAFVRKRDKRVQAFAKQLEAKNADNRRKQEEMRKQKILDRKKEIHNESKTQADWTKFDNVQVELKEIEKKLAEQFGETLSETDSEEENYNDLYCISCNKLFKNPKAFANHESSKKHKENTERLKEMVLDEEEELEKYLDSEETSSEEKEINELSLSSEPEESEEIVTSSKKKIKKNKKIIRIHDNNVSEDTSDKEIKINIVNISDEDFDFGSSSKKSKKKNKAKSNNTAPVQEATPQPELPTVVETTPKSEVPTVVETTPKPVAERTKNKSNAKSKQNKNKQLPINLEDIDVSHVCVTCKSNFISKNKLFDHLKKTGHSVLVSQANQKLSKSKKKSVK